MTTYDKAIDFLYTQLPMFQRSGAPAYKPGLDTAIALDNAFGNPHRHYPTVHVGGTNGKGSTSHSIAAILQSAGYKVGLYTSPHLVDFRERMRVDGHMISREAVVDFVDRYRTMSLDVHPSFFELTMTMAFEYFAREKVDIAVIEVGLGGRLDSTNIITPILSIITNISFDHTAFLGNTLPAIATEKAGIIKPSIPVVIGEAEGEVKQVFADKAAETGAPVIFAEKRNPYIEAIKTDDGYLYRATPWGDIRGELSGDCQPHNAATVMTAIEQLQHIGWHIPPQAVTNGMSNVCRLTGLMGRWMSLQSSPRVICDTGHNVGGWKYISRQLTNTNASRRHMIIGFVNDKDISHILDLMPHDAIYYFTQASIPRALAAEDVATIAMKKGLHGTHYPTVADAYHAALSTATADDLIFVGGSTFIVADLLSHLNDRK